jgi:hypothetical protein
MANFLETMIGGTAAGMGFVLGVGGTLAAMQRMRPLVRQAIKSYLVTSQRAREATAELGETLDDLYAEAKAELEAEASEPRPMAASPTPQ